MLVWSLQSSSLQVFTPPSLFLWHPPKNQKSRGKKKGRPEELGARFAADPLGLLSSAKTEVEWAQDRSLRVHHAVGRGGRRRFQSKSARGENRQGSMADGNLEKLLPAEDGRRLSWVVMAHERDAVSVLGS